MLHVPKLKTTKEIMKTSSRLKQLVAPAISCRYSSSASEYLHKSNLPTYHFQNCLPRLPIPKLEDTMSRYMRSLKALKGHPDIDEAAIMETQRAVNAFMKFEGPAIHEVLIAENAKNSGTSYITKPWFDMYLESRLPLPLNYNPYLTYKRDPVEQMNEQVTRSTNLIISAMKFKKTLEAEILSPEVFYMNDKAKSPFIQTSVKYLPNQLMLRYLPMVMSQAYPLDMSQFKNLFSSTRIPQTGKDVLETYKDSRHIIVIRNGHFYKVTALNTDGSIVDPLKLKSCLNRIKADRRSPPEHSVAYLTTTERDIWADTRSHLLQSGNEQSLLDVDSAIFCLVLDDSTDVETPEKSAETFLYGDGASRWFDKSFSLIVAGNGDTALNFEHAWGDGVAVMRFFNDVFSDSTSHPSISHDTPTHDGDLSELIQQVEFNVDEKTKERITQAKAGYDKATGSLRVAAGQFDKMNKEYLKRKKVSPDGIMQLAIQVGHHKFCGHPAPTYESCSTSAFKHGRTETIRSCTLEAQEAARAIVEGSSGVVNKLKDDADYRSKVDDLIRKSCNRHNELTKEAAMGKGFDRHMFGLRHTAEKVIGREIPAIFRDFSYTTMNQIVLSTSTLSSPAVTIGGFAPVIPNGFGVGYGVKDEMLGCNITSYDVRDVGSLVEAIMTSLDDIHTVLEG
uniref:carnitine O-palmitoyltransferase 2, mitochondrial n=1 Tax=Ciona intestinalis TaxID=7719 RepID=UPI000180C4E7|nr:carnitine O-palmitoyltransferase 2, mitochondrial [Ciona intestinalis]|eukprot:XP_026694536.1 carnitine O-palmitoyltransferase 2, mitochondrial [Ciona intestinalis]